METKLADKKDFEQCLDLDEFITGSDKKKEFLRQRSEHNRMYVAVQEDRVAGLVTFEPDFFGCLFVSLLVVHRDFRRKGVARKLMEKVATHSTDGRLFSSTEEDNEISLKMHEALGFRRSGYVENLPQPKREIILFRELGQE